MVRLLKYFVIFLSLSTLSHAGSNNLIRIVGSTSFYPIISKLAEDFGNKTGYKIPLIEATGTGAGFKIFCMGKNTNYPDIVMASREIKDSERAMCAKNGVNNIESMLVGKDAIVFVTHKHFKLNNISRIHLAEALSNIKINKFKDLDQSLPNTYIKFYGPGSNSTNYDAIQDMVIKPALGPNKKIRNDNQYIQNGSNNNIIISKVLENKNSIGIIPIEYYNPYKSKLKILAIDGVIASNSNIKNNSYPLSRSLILYYSKDKEGFNASLKEFLYYVQEHGMSF